MRKQATDKRKLGGAAVKDGERKALTRQKAALALNVTSSREYRDWIVDLRKRYRAAQVKAAVSVNSALLQFYWNLGKDISEKYATTQYYGSHFFECVSKDLTGAIRNPIGLSVANIRYCQRFYELYAGMRNLQQVVEELVMVAWGHKWRIVA